MRRGFKAHAERLAEVVRNEMGIQPSDGMDAAVLAIHAGARVQPADELVSLNKLVDLEALQSGAFSACTFYVGGRSIIIYNPLASGGRNQSDIAHEVAHILLGHDLQQVHRVETFAFFTCDPDEEQEANWLAGCLLLPRKLLLYSVRRGLDATDVARTYGVSVNMAEFRIRATGVLRQIRGSRRQ